MFIYSSRQHPHSRASSLSLVSALLDHRRIAPQMWFLLEISVLCSTQIEPSPDAHMLLRFRRVDKNWIDPPHHMLLRSRNIEFMCRGLDFVSFNPLTLSLQCSSKNQTSIYMMHRTKLHLYRVLPPLAKQQTCPP